MPIFMSGVSGAVPGRPSALFRIGTETVSLADLFDFLLGLLRSTDPFALLNSPDFYFEIFFTNGYASCYLSEIWCMDWIR